MTDIAIKVKNLTKIYPLYSKHINRMKEALHPFRKKYHHDFHALKDVSFEIKKGETVGIIGKNGAGKSTLLKILTGVLTPTSGLVQVKGRVSSLLELGTGFNPDLTGIENIYFNGTINGLTDKEIKLKLNDIISFADIGEFISQPVKMYSSGMFARLAFAVAINTDPDILIVDEALSVGDISFQSKCFNKFREFQKKGITILFVTHSVDLIIKYCNSAILLSNGEKLAEGDTKTTVELFRKIMVKTENTNEISAGLESESSIPVSSKPMKEQFELNPNPLEYGTKEAEIIDFGIINSKGKITNNLYHNEEYTVALNIKFLTDLQDPIFAYTIKSVDGLELTGTNSLYLEHHTGFMKKGQLIKAQFKQTMILNSGNYLLCLGCTKYEPDNLKIFHRIYDAAPVQVVSKSFGFGIAFAPSNLTIGAADL